MSNSGFSLHRISHAKILNRVAISFSRVSSQPRDGNPRLLHWQRDSSPLSHQGLNIVELKAANLCLTLGKPMDYTVLGILQAWILEWVAFPFYRGSSQTRSPTLQADSLPAEPSRKPKNTGVGSLCLLQWIFLTQELNQGLLHCRWILYHWATWEAPHY